jgi:type I restriction-modification system DNA methylase subunit
MIMELSKTERLSLYSLLRREFSVFSATDIENGVMLYSLTSYGCNATRYEDKNASIIADKLKQNRFPTDLETIIEFFESLLEEDNKDENGIVFTPQYIAEYITFAAVTQKDSIRDTALFADPGCGCGIFLIAAAEALLSVTSKSIDSIIEDNIFGIDIDEDNVRRCKLVMQLLSAKHGGKYEEVRANILCGDSLKINWAAAFGVEAFDYIIGNPPYVNPHDMNKDTVTFLKNTYVTTQNGVFNIFYAFIEKGMEQLNSNGLLSFIVPNNFLTIKSAVELREYLQTNAFIKRILDFGDNMVFKPVRTYNCIILLSREKHSSFEYCVLSKTDDIKSAISTASFNSMMIDALDKNGWKLVDEKTRRNLGRIESQFIPIKSFIRTGIATLKDGVYLVEKDECGYFKVFDGKKLYIESGLVKPIYKVPELKFRNSIDDAKRFIIFPYVKTNAGYTLIDEATFAESYPHTYECLSLQREELDARDKGKGVARGWYAYGRTQGLNKYGRKLLFPTFANAPKFLLVDDEDALFCNGYAVFENDQYDLDILGKILNSCLMDYYVSNTSYSIEGGYYCYQKKYVERFSIPWLTEEERAFIRNASKGDLDDYLWNLYGLE